MGKSIHAGAQVVADGSDEAALRLERVLTNDPGTGVMRHADAGYDRARQVAEERGVRIPMGPNRSPQPPDHAGRRGGALNGGRGRCSLRTATPKCRLLVAGPGGVAICPNAPSWRSKSSGSAPTPGSMATW